MLHVTERKRLYEFLAVFFGYPDSKLLVRLAGPEPQALAALLPDCPLPPGPASPSSRELETAFTEAFINRMGGAIAPPYGSVYLDPGARLAGASTRQVLDAYREAGLSLDQTVEPPDYLPTELEFLFFLVGEEEAALQKRVLKKALDFLRQQKAFFLGLVDPWIQSFCKQLLDSPDTHPWYRWGAEVLERFAEQEREWLERQ